MAAGDGRGGAPSPTPPGHSDGTPHPTPAILIGTLPREAPRALARMGVPFVWVVDPDDPPPSPEVHASAIVPCPFRSDPLGILRIPLPGEVRGVLSLTELGQLPAALLSEALGLASVPVRAVLRARNKLHMRRTLSGVSAQPLFGLVGADAPPPDAFPVVVKPLEGSGSQGVEYAADAAAYRRRAEERAGALWEQFVPGAEYSVEAVTVKGSHQVLAVTAKRTTGPPYFVETGHETPAPLSPAVEEGIHTAVRTCLDALDVTVGATHTEVVVDGDGEVVVIETHTRVGGDRITLLTELVTGSDQCELAFRCHLDESGGCVTAPRYRHAAVRYLPWQDVEVVAVDGVDACRALPGVEEVQLRVGAGDRVPVWRSSRDRPGHLVVGADSRPELRQRLRAAEAALRPVLRPAPTAGRER